MSPFKKLDIDQKILDSLGIEFVKPTFIQEKTIPLILEKRDVIGLSATGSGKTFAFGVGLIQHLNHNNFVQGIVLTPTRELAEQVHSALNKFSEYKKLNIIAVYGGVAINPQIKHLESADIVVATPGRLLDHLQRGTINLSKVKILVLDEADRMVDMGFIDDVKKIISQCSHDRQTLLFSATMSPDVKKIQSKFMKDPILIQAERQVDPSKLKQCYYDVNDKTKFSLLVHLLKQEHYGSVIVFCNTRIQVDFVSKNLRANSIDAVPIHGGFTQAKRSQSMTQFHSKRVEVLVCTDVAARGLDIPGVSHIYNYDQPSDTKDYIHRIGRTARAGKDGKVVNLISRRDYDNFSHILAVYPDIIVEKLITPEVERATIKEETKTRRSFSRIPKSMFGSRNNQDGGRRPLRPKPSPEQKKEEKRNFGRRKSFQNKETNKNKFKRKKF